MQGHKLGPYSILEQLGAGGMGEVWLAQDSRLGRKVAIKILPEQFATDPERLARFEQEARAAAALNHPNIAVTHDVGEADGTHFIVQEYLQGRTLREALDSGPLPLARALALGAEIAAALKASHAAGIVHRDLKPDNVFVTEDGHAKVLDFGLAKLVETPGAPPGSATMSPTMLGTQVGAIMGTAGYMAPEQVNGEEVDHRADLFAFGCLLYEMVTGRQPFQGQNVYETLGRIVSSEPDRLEMHLRDAPAELQRLVRKCLAKDPAKRAWSAGDLAVDLKMLAADLEAGVVVPASPPGATGADAPGTAWSIGRVAAVVAVAALLAAAATWWTTRPAPVGPQPVVRFLMPLPAGTEFSDLITSDTAVSRDGRQIVFAGSDQLWLRRLEEEEARPIRYTEGASDPAFSPDGQQLAFAVDGQIKRVLLAGGAPVDVGPFVGNSADGIWWGEDGYLYFSDEPTGIMRVPESGGSPEVVVAPMAGGETFGPQLLPGGEWVLYSESPPDREFSSSRILLYRLGAEAPIELPVVGRQPRYVPTGHLLWVSNGVLFAQPFDLQRRELRGSPAALIDGVRVGTARFSGTAHYGVSDNGLLAYISGTATMADRSVALWRDADGTETVLPIEPAAFIGLALSPDGSRVAMQRSSEFDLWLYEADRRRGQLVNDEGFAGAPVWSPDGRWIYFTYTQATEMPDIWRRPADLSGPMERVGGTDGVDLPSSIASDGSRLYFDSEGPGGARDIYSLQLEGDGEVRPVLVTDADEASPAISPDGRYLAYDSNAARTRDVYVLDLNTQSRRLVSSDRGLRPKWSPTGDALYYRDQSGNMMRVPVRAGEVAEFGAPEVFHASASFILDYAVSGDGSRLLELRESAEGSRALEGINVVTNWFEELRARAPSDR